MYLSFTSAEVTDNIDAGGGNVWGLLFQPVQLLDLLLVQGQHTLKMKLVCWRPALIWTICRIIHQIVIIIKFYTGTDVGSHAGWKVIDNHKFNIGGIMQKLAVDVNETENGGTTCYLRGY